MRIARLASLLLVVACGPSSGGQAAPVDAQYELSFPSTAATVATDTVEVLVFDANQTGADCLSLITAEASSAALPQAPALLARSAPISPCNLFEAAAGAEEGGVASGTLEGVSFGSRSFFAIAQREGADFLVGCVPVVVSAEVSTVVIPLIPANLTVTVPGTSCASLSAKCAGSCS